MRLIGRLAGMTALAAACVGISTTAASAAPNNWGQEVKACNQASCYPGGTNRGAYVSGQAGDGQGPGYAWEIHQFASPGNSNPRPFN